MTDTDTDTDSQRPGAAEPATTRRSYHRWAKNDTLEDYSLRYAPKSFRRWTPYVVATTALGGIAYLADFAIGGSLAISNGFSSAIVGALDAAAGNFLARVPLLFHSRKYSHDTEPLTPAAGVRRLR